MKVLITGAEGQLGSTFMDSLAKFSDVCGVDKGDFDIYNTEGTLNYVSSVDPDIIIHSAAFTNVDGCEENPDKAFRVNSLGTRNLAVVARSIDATMVYISTDYVFGEGMTKNIREFDDKNPETSYGKSKLLGEEYVKEQLNKFFIFRVAWLYGTKGENFVKTMLRLAKKKEKIRVVDDQVGSPTQTEDVVNQVEEMLESKKYGTYHCTSQGSCSWYEFAREVFLQAGYRIERENQDSLELVPEGTESLSVLTEESGSLSSIELIRISSQDLDRPASRPKQSVLENYMLKLENMDQMPHWKESLKSYFDMY